MTFLDCVVYHVRDARYPGGSVRVLAEPELEGRFTKWNNNAGAVRHRGPGRGGAAAESTAGGLGAIGEDGSESEEEGGGAECGGGCGGGGCAAGLLALHFRGDGGQAAGL